MAADEDLVSGDGWISDESSFYGDDDIKDELEQQATKQSNHSYWRSRANDHLALIIQSAKRKQAIQAKPESNSFEGQSHNARQLHESVEEFVQRLPPLTTRLDGQEPWISIANPHAEQETPSDLPSLAREGQQLIETFSEKIANAQYELRHRSKAQITRAVMSLRDQFKDHVLELAEKYQLVSGKWLLRIPSEYVNNVWLKVAQNVVEGKLGPMAKIAPLESEAQDAKEGRLICVYTENFQDREDVERVLQKLLAIDVARRAIYYKPEVYTHLGLASGNAVGIKTSIFSSNDFSKTKG